MISNNHLATKLPVVISTVLLIIFFTPDLCYSRSRRTLESAGCLCDLYGTINPYICNLKSDSQRCQCKEGHTGSDCADCLVHYYRPGPAEVCRECGCSLQGSLGPSCGRSGACKCESGFSGNGCDTCQNGYFLTGTRCQLCQCERLDSCLQLKDSDVQCTPCLTDVSWAKRCNVCHAAYDVILSENRLECVTPQTSSVMEATNGSVSKAPEANVQSGLPMSTMYAIIVITVLIVLVIFFVILIVYKRKRTLSHPANFPFWTVELRHDDVTALANGTNSDMDVMYLDDAYLMNTPENFTTTVDSVHEDDHIGYHTLR